MWQPETAVQRRHYSRGSKMVYMLCVVVVSLPMAKAYATWARLRQRNTETGDHPLPGRNLLQNCLTKWICG